MKRRNDWKRTITVGCALLVTLFAVSRAEAQESGGGLFVEPALTYETSSTSINFPAPLSDSSGKVEGFGAGARLGLHMQEALFLGVDGRYSMPTFTDSSTNYSASAKAWNWAPVLGLQMPNVGLRLWGAYVLGGELDPAASGNVDVKFTDMKGYRLGAGFRVGAASLNLEYQDVKFGKTTLEQFGPFNPATAFDDVTLKNKSWMASVSMPLEL